MGGELNPVNRSEVIAMEPENGKLVKLGEPNKNNTRIKKKRHIFATVVICNYIIKYCYTFLTLW
jgi:hypothetical protein